MIHTIIRIHIIIIIIRTHIIIRIRTITHTAIPIAAIGGNINDDEGDVVD